MRGISSARAVIAKAVSVLCRSCAAHAKPAAATISALPNIGKFRPIWNLARFRPEDRRQPLCCIYVRRPRDPFDFGSPREKPRPGSSALRSLCVSNDRAIRTADRYGVRRCGDHRCRISPSRRHRASASSPVAALRSGRANRRSFAGQQSPGTCSSDCYWRNFPGPSQCICFRNLGRACANHSVDEPIGRPGYDFGTGAEHRASPTSVWDHFQCGGAWRSCQQGECRHRDSVRHGRNSRRWHPTMARRCLDI